MMLAYASGRKQKSRRLGLLGFRASTELATLWTERGAIEAKGLIV